MISPPAPGNGKEIPAGGHSPAFHHHGGGTGTVTPSCVDHDNDVDIDVASTATLSLTIGTLVWDLVTFNDHCIKGPDFHILEAICDDHHLKYEKVQCPSLHCIETINSARCQTCQEVLGGVPGAALCPDGCHDLDNDLNNCGNCGTTCMQPQSCVSGQCACPPLQTLCGNTCVDLQTDNAHCGVCNNPCMMGQSCQAGGCVTSQPFGGNCMGNSDCQSGMCFTGRGTCTKNCMSAMDCAPFFMTCGPDPTMTFMGNICN